MVDEQPDRSCPRQSWSPHNCARHDSHPRGRADAIAVKHSAQAPRETLWKQTPRQTCVRDLLNARTCSSRRDLVTASPLAQEVSATRSYLDPRAFRVGVYSPGFPFVATLL